MRCAFILALAMLAACAPSRKTVNERSVGGASDPGNAKNAPDLATPSKPEAQDGEKEPDPKPPEGDGTPEAGPAEEPDFETWRHMRTIRQATLDSYLKSRWDDFDWFLHWEFGKGGALPIGYIFLLPPAFPEIWHKQWRDELGIPDHPKEFEDMDAYREQGKHDNLPLGFIRADGDSILGSKIQVAGQTCASCHVGRVKDYDGKVHFLIGAPNTTWDPLLFKRKIYDTVTDPAFLKDETLTFTHEKLRTLGFTNYQIALYDAFWLSEGVIGIRGKTKAALTEPDYLDQRVYKADQTKDFRMRGGMPGHVDIFSPIINSQSTALAKATPEERDALLKAVLPDAPVIVDFMSVWMQGRQKYGQWDGNSPNHLLRNLGAQVAGITDPKHVDFQNGIKTTRFLAELPSPPYLFDVDWIKAARGRKIFNATCNQCHVGNKFIPLTMVKTDPNRALGLKEPARKVLADLLLKSCHDKKNPACTMRNDEVIIDRSKNPGYMAPFLDGIWARAPYLHNGSVPTLYHMLVPDERPAKFWRGNMEYDTAKVGFVWDKPLRKGFGKDGDNTIYAKEYDTKLTGYRNTGHGSDPKDRKLFFGRYDFGKDVKAREDLLEYLKSL